MMKEQSELGPQRLPKIRFYRTIAATFVALVMTLLTFVIYLSFVKAVVTIKSKPVPVTANFNVDIAKEPQDNSVVKGIVISETREGSKTYNVPGGVEVPAKASGLVTIINTTSRNQPLVKTTRLLTSEGVLFRIVKNVVVPARGSVEVVAEADQLGEVGDIGPAHFTIPGLAPLLQTLIYAQSSVPMIGGLQAQAKVSAALLESAMSELSKSLFMEARTAVEEIRQFQGFSGIFYEEKVIEKKSDTVPGTAAAKFALSVKVRVTGVFFDRLSLESFARAKLFSQLSDDFTLREINSDAFEISLASYNVERGSATLRVSAVGSARLKEGGAILNKDRISGLEASATERYFKGYNEVESVKVEIRPFWVKTLPKLKDHIDFIIE